MTTVGALALSLPVGLREPTVGTRGLGHRRVKPSNEHSAEDKGLGVNEGSEMIPRCDCWRGKLDRGDAITKEEEGINRAIIPAMLVLSKSVDHVLTEKGDKVDDRRFINPIIHE